MKKNRRSFLKLIGFGAAALGSLVVGKVAFSQRKPDVEDDSVRKFTEENVILPEKKADRILDKPPLHVSKFHFDYPLVPAQTFPLVPGSCIPLVPGPINPNTIDTGGSHYWSSTTDGKTDWQWTM